MGNMDPEQECVLSTRPRQDTKTEAPLGPVYPKGGKKKIAEESKDCRNNTAKCSEHSVL